MELRLQTSSGDSSDPKPFDTLAFDYLSSDAAARPARDQMSIANRVRLRPCSASTDRALCCGTE